MMSFKGLLGTVWIACAVLIAGGAPALAQAPGSGDPSFPKGVPPVSPPKPEKDDKPTKPRRDVSPPTSDPRGPGMVDLRPRFRAGQETRYVMKIDSQNDVGNPGMVVPGQKSGEAQTQDMKEEIGFVIRAKDASAEEGATVELVYERVKVSLKTGDTELFWDSTQPSRPNDDSDLIAPYFKPMVGSKLTIKFDATGNIKSVEGGTEMALPGMMGQAGIDPKSIGSLFGPIQTDASGKGVYRVGQKWTNVDTIDTGPFGRFKMMTEHTLRTAFAGSAEVLFKGHMEPGSESGTPGSPFQLQHSTTEGKYVWDTDRGELRSMESEQEISLGSGPGGKGAGMKSKTTVRVEREKGWSPGGLPAMPSKPSR